MKHQKYRMFTSVSKISLRAFFTTYKAWNLCLKSNHIIITFNRLFGISYRLEWIIYENQLIENNSSVFSSCDWCNWKEISVWNFIHIPPTYSRKLPCIKWKSLRNKTHFRTKISSDIVPRYKMSSQSPRVILNQYVNFNLLIHI